MFAEGQAAIVADEIIAQVCGGSAAGHDGRGVCSLGFGGEGVAVVDVTFVGGRAPFGVLNGPSTELIAEKSAFGTTRIKRWFGRDW